MAYQGQQNSGHGWNLSLFDWYVMWHKVATTRMNGAYAPHI